MPALRVVVGGLGAGLLGIDKATPLVRAASAGRSALRRKAETEQTGDESQTT